MTVLKFSLFSTDIFLAMHVTMSLGIAGVHPSLSSSGSKASKRAGSKDTDGSTTGEAVEKVSMSFLIYEDTKMFIYKEINMKWQDINDAFSGTFEENLEDNWVSVNIYKSGLYQIACRYPSFPCADIIH